MPWDDLTAEERRTLEVIEIYRAEHTTWDLERLRSIFADDPAIHMNDVSHIGKEAVDKRLVDWCSRPGHKTEMRHKRVVVQGNRAAVEWTNTGADGQGRQIDMAGANVYELDNGKIKYLRIYRAK